MANPVTRLFHLARDAGPQIARDAAIYRVHRGLYGLRHPSRKPGGNWQTPGDMIGSEKHDRGLTITFRRGLLRLTVISPDCVQVRWQPNQSSKSTKADKMPVPFSYAVAKVTWPDVPFTVSESDETITLSTDAIRCQVTRLTGKLQFFDSAGRGIGGDADGISWRGSGAKIQSRLSRTLPMRNDATCVGLAEQPTVLDIRGQRYQLWNTSPTDYGRGANPIYFTIPFYMDIYSDRAAGFFWDNPSRGEIDAGKATAERIIFESERGELRYYVFAGIDVAAVLSRYTELTGRMPLPPRWALGLHQSRWSYESAERVRDIAAGFRKRKIPCDAIHLDLAYMDGNRPFTWDRTAFPSPAGLVSDLQTDGFQTVVLLDPGIKADAAYSVDQSGLKDGMFVTYPNGKPFSGPVWAGTAHFPDFSEPKVRAWWAAQFESLAKIGIAGAWNDMNEPVVFNLGGSQTIPDDARHNFEGQSLTHVEAHNVYGMLMARASREGLERFWPNKRPFNITRAAHAGAQRYASSWTGSNRSTWDHLRLSLTMTLACGLSGLAFTGPDTGGFSGDCSPELFARWVQLSSLLPFFRIHSAKNTHAQEPWAFGTEIESIARAAIEWRYQLLPYLYSVFAQCAQSGLPIIRPLWMADPADMALRTVEVAADEFLLGDNLLVAPVLDKGVTKRDVYLPRGKWYDFWSHQLVEGGKQFSTDAPLNRLPLFARAGAVIPLWPIMQYTTEAVVDELRLKVYAGSGEVTLYEDAGEGTAYQRGEYRWLYFTVAAQSDGGLTLTWRRAGQFVPTYQRVRVEVYGIRAEPQSVLLDGQSAPLWYYENGVVEFTANKPFDTVRIVPKSESEASSTLMRPPAGLK
jgi:alpha-glucosidase